MKAKAEKRRERSETKRKTERKVSVVWRPACALELTEYSKGEAAHMMDAGMHDIRGEGLQGKRERGKRGRKTR